jgi:hypothetical protein
LALTIRDLASVDVDLWGKKFETVPPTRSVLQQIAALEGKLREIPDDQTDDLVELLAQIIDLRLKPAGQGRKTASACILEKWNADELTVGQLIDFSEAVGDADRPT